MLARKFFGKVLFFGVALMFFGLFQPATADTVDVSIPGFSFDPIMVTINQGTTVKWTNNHSISHTSTSDGAVWDSETLTAGASFSYTFNTAGVFPYHCTFHPSMVGTVTVAASTHIPSTTPFGLIILIALIAVSAIVIYRRYKLAAAE